MTVKCKAEESLACSCVDVGAVIDGSDCSYNFEKTFASKELAQSALATLTEKARKIESEPCEIQSDIQETAEGAVLKAQFTFSCQAEAMIFELGNR